MKTFLFVDSSNNSIMMVNATTSKEAAEIVGKQTDLQDNKYVLIGALDHKIGYCSEHTYI